MSFSQKQHKDNLEKCLEKWSASKYALSEFSPEQLIPVEGLVKQWKNEYVGWSFDTLGVAYARDGAVFLTDQWNPRLYLLDSDRNTLTLIKDDLPADGGGLDYNHARDTVLWAVDGEVREIDRSGEVVNSLSTGQGGNAGHWSSKNTFVLVTGGGADGHYAFEMDWDGNELWSFGTQGSSGSDLSHLNYPRDVCMHGNNYLIADSNNDRLVEDGDGDGVAETVNVVSEPGNVEPIYPTSNILVSTGFSNEYPWLTLLLGSTGGDNKILGSVSAHSNDLSVHPKLPLFALVQHNAIEEIGLRSLKQRPLDPQELKPLDGVSIGAGNTYTTRPMVVAPYDKMSIYSKGDQSHDVTVERLRTNHNLDIEANTKSFDNFDTLSVSANSLGQWTKNPALRLFVVRLTVENTGGSSGTFNTWVSFK